MPEPQVLLYIPGLLYGMVGFAFCGLFSAGRCSTSKRQWGILTLLSVWFAQCQAFDPWMMEVTSHSPANLGEAKTPPTLILKGDGAGAAQDLLQRIQEYQAPALGVYQQQVDLPVPEAQPPEIQMHELDLMLQYPGQQAFTFYRPNPHGLVRPSELHYEAMATTSLDDFRVFLLMHWPDLPASQHWQLLDFDDAWEQSPLFPSHSRAILVWSSNDLLAPQGSIIATVETQVWDLRNGHLIATIMPMALWRDTTMTDLMGHLQLRDSCTHSPCVLRQNGEDHPWRRPITLWDAAHIRIATMTQSSQVRTLLDRPADFDPVHPGSIPPAFWQKAGIAATTMWPEKLDQVINNAQQLQVSLSLQARSIHMLTGMHALDRPQVDVMLMVPDDPEAHAILHHAHRDPFGLLFDILDSYDMSPELIWKFVKVNEAYQPAGQIPRDYAILMQAPQFPRDGHVVILVFVDIQTTPSDFFLRIRTVPRNFFGQDLTDYAIDFSPQSCQLFVNGFAMAMNQMVNLDMGDFLHVICSDEKEDMAINETGIMEHVMEDIDMAEPPPKRFREGHTTSTTMNTSNTTCQHPPPGMDLCFVWSFIGIWALLCRFFSFIRWFIIVSSSRSARVIRPYPHRQTSCAVRLSWTWRPSCTWSISIAVLMCTMMTATGLQVIRYGEASHPGPDVWFGTTNPSGLAGKEFIYGNLPAGIWGVSESQLSIIGQKRSKNIFAGISRNTGRNLACHFGAPVELRARSAEAGTWSGVMLVGDAHFRGVMIPWEADEYRLGRVQVAQAWIGALSILTTNVYGWAKSPTWPKAATFNNQLMEQITQQIVLSRSGPRIIIGDMNVQPHESTHFEVWRQNGWMEVQAWSQYMHGTTTVMTSHGTNQLDHVWISPELIPYLRTVQHWDFLPDHTIVGACFDLPVQQFEYLSWPLPAAIPWSCIRKDDWQAEATCTLDTSGDLSADFQHFCQHYESSFHGYVDTPSHSLPTTCQGRGQISKPVNRKATFPLLKPSRPGEVHQVTEFLGRAVQKWFMQLRRIQSMVHALKADKDTPDALVYRIELWRAIRKAQGFHGTFAKWWPTRPTRLQGSPLSISQCVPSLLKIQAIFTDFQLNYKKFERWHFKQRQSLLALSSEHQKSRLFAAVKPDQKPQLTHLEERTMVEVIGVSENGQQIQVSESLVLQDPYEIQISSLPLQVYAVNGDVIDIDEDTLVTPGVEMEVIQHYATPPQQHQALASFWTKRWCRDPPQPEAWQRIMDFAKHYMPHGQSGRETITPETWTAINRRYKATAARGPDGFSGKELLWMPPTLVHNLVDQIRKWEEAGQWPIQLCTGFVHPLPKKADAIKVGDFRPIIIYSTIYRSWASLRARSILQHVATFADGHQFGFLPTCETTEIWMVLQGLIELSHMSGEVKCGYVTDVVKAFESIPRQPVFDLCLQLGVDPIVIRLWSSFLFSMERRFKLNDTVGPGLRSTSGFPEGCGMSCVAMAIVDLSFHCYMRAFCPSPVAISYVDNLELIAENVATLGHAIPCVQAWADMWMLQLDDEKTYVWGNTPECRRDLAILGWVIREVARDLGAQINYGRKKTVKEQQNRLEALSPLWRLLSRTWAPEFQRMQLLYQAFWPKAFHGISNCTLGWHHVVHLRTAAMKALRLGRGGANPGLRLGLLSASPLCDPGFYQCWMVLSTLRRLIDKQPSLLQLWSRYMSQWTGEDTQGPFGKLVEITQQLGWSIQIPHLQDHDGVQWHLQECDFSAFRRTLEEAWIQRIAADAARRRDFQGLDGVDYDVLRKAQAGLLPHEKAALLPLRDGTFVEPRQQAKFDLSKEVHCEWCGAPDSVAHRTFECRAFQTSREQYQDLVNLRSSVPDSLSIRLLPNRNPYLRQFRYLMGQQEDIDQVTSRKPQGPHLHLFSDGSCLCPEQPSHALAAYAVISATDDMVIAEGTCGGMVQNSDAAELRAAVIAVEWLTRGRTAATLWTDSAYVATNLFTLIHNQILPESYQQDWLRILHALQDHPYSVGVQHVAAHRASTAQYQEVDEWTAYWNGRADHQAMQAHRLRATNISTLWTQLRNHHELALQRLIRFQRLHLDVLLARQDAGSNRRLLQEDCEVDIDAPADSFMVRQCAADWQLQLETPIWGALAIQNLVDQFGRPFTGAVLDWLWQQTRAADLVAVQYSFLELAFFWGTRRTEVLPRPDGSTKARWVPNLGGPHIGESATVATVLRLIRHFFVALPFCEADLCRHIDLSQYGVFTPLAGVKLMVSRDMATQILALITSFTTRRPIRRANDLARPFHLA